MKNASSIRQTASRGTLLSRRTWLTLALICGSSLCVSAVKFTATLDRNSAVVGEAVTLTLSFEGGKPQELSSLPPIDGIRVASEVSSRFNTSITPQGSVTVQAYSLDLVPTRAGEFVIPPFTARANGERLVSEPIKLKVLTSDPSSPPPDFARRPAFLWMMPTRKELFVGETIQVELRLYMRNEFRHPDNLQIPLAGEGFSFSQLVNTQPFQRRVGTSAFTIIPFYFALTPVKAGTLTLGPVNGGVRLIAGDGFIFGPPPQQVPLALEAQTFQVSPLPTGNAPTNFNGAVGTYTLAVTAGPTNVAAGDPITVRIQISGEGHLDALMLPEQAWQDFKCYPPTSKVESQNPLQVQGSKTFEQIVIPQKPEIRALPPFSFTYFDPARKCYQTLTQPAIPLTVRPGGTVIAPANSNVPGATENPAGTADIVPIKQRLGTVAAIQPALVQRPWFLALQSVPVIVWLGALVWRKYGEALALDPRRRRHRRVAQLIREGLNELRRCAAANDSDGFFAMLFRLLQGQLGERLDLPATAITEAVIEEQLRPQGVPEPTLETLHELFQLCNQARYAPFQSSQELAALIPKLQSVLRELQKLKS